MSMCVYTKTHRPLCSKINTWIYGTTHTKTGNIYAKYTHNIYKQCLHNQSIYIQVHTHAQVVEVLRSGWMGWGNLTGLDDIHTLSHTHTRTHNIHAQVVEVLRGGWMGWGNLTGLDVSGNTIPTDCLFRLAETLPSCPALQVKYIRTHTHTRQHTHKHTRLHTHTYTHMHTHTHTHSLYFSRTMVDAEGMRTMSTHTHPRIPAQDKH